MVRDIHPGTLAPRCGLDVVAQFAIRPVGDLNADDDVVRRPPGTANPPRAHDNARVCRLSFLFELRDKHYGMQLYHSNPSGNYSGWKATAIGANNQSAQSILKSDYKDDIEIDDAVKLALKVLNKTMDSTALTPEKVELVTVRLSDRDACVEARQPLRPATRV